MAVVVGWVLFSILVGVLADKNGRSGLLAFVVSVCVSPVFGGILYLILGKTDLTRAHQAVADEKLIASIRDEKSNDRFVPKSEKSNDSFWVMLGLVVLVVLIFYSMTLN